MNKREDWFGDATDEFNYKDDKGVSYHSVQDWFVSEVIGICGCGTEDFRYDIVDMFMKFDNEDGFHHFKDTDRFEELVLNIFSDKGLTEHGTSIFGGWLTDEGKLVLGKIKEGKDE